MCVFLYQGEVGEPGQKGSKGDKGEQVGDTEHLYPSFKIKNSPLDFYSGSDSWVLGFFFDSVGMRILVA